MNNKKKPYIKVIYEDVRENLTEQNIKKIKRYFENKYNSSSVKVIPVVNNKENKDLEIQITTNDNITDKDFQKNLIKTYIEQNNITVDWNLLDRLDNKVNEKLLENDKDKIKYSSWQIKKIEFSNFLSFGDDNIVDYTQLNGITNIESSPRNFGGKTTMIVDLILFLFFNKTTKTKTNSELFNKFTNKDEIKVKGEIIIDNQIFIIERIVSRKLKRNGDYDITSKLDFFTVDENNIIKNLNDEQRRKTEVLITSAIGDEEDFLLTILTTGSNLEELIESKPTARGNILTKFIGLEILKKKELIAKEIYNDWSKKLVSNNYDVTSLKNENDKIISDEVIINENILNLNNNYKSKEKEIFSLEEENENLLKKRKNINETDLLNFNLEQNEELIKTNEIKIIQIKNSLDNVKVIEPNKYYLESDHKKVIDDISKLNENIFKNKQLISTETKMIYDLEHSKICPTCKREFEGINNDEKIAECNLKISNLNLLLQENNDNLEKLLLQKKELDTLKSDFDFYEKNKLLKTKYELEIEQKENIISNIKAKIDRYKIDKLNIEENKLIDISIQTNKTILLTLKGELKLIIQNLEKNKNLLNNNSIKLTQNEELIKKINSENELAKIFQVYLSIFGKNGISKLILKNVIPKINEELFDLLIDSCNFTVELIINDKNEVEFNMIDNETRISKSLSSGSGFEKTIASLALRSVLTKISTLPKPNIMIMDEIFGKVANENLDLIGEFFIKIKKYFESIIIISHNPLVKNWSDNNILVTKENNISKIL